MIVTRHRPLFSLRCTHAYFADGVGRVVTPRPSAGCRALLASERMLPRVVPGAVTVHAPDWFDPGSAGEGAAFTFLLECGDPYLANYTENDAPQAPGQTACVRYFDNLDAPDGLLKPQRLPLMRRRFRLPLPEPLAIGELSVCASSGRELWRQAPLAATRSSIELDLRELDDGRYRLLMNGGQLQDFFLSDADAGRLWGVAAVYATGLVAGRETGLTIRLDSRRTRWRYLVMPPSAPAASYGEFTLEATDLSSGAPVAFERAAHDNAVACFVSAAPLPFAERPEQQFRITLLARDKATGRTHSIPVHYAQPRVLTQPGPGPNAYSDIYVYL